MEFLQVLYVIYINCKTLVRTNNIIKFQHLLQLQCIVSKYMFYASWYCSASWVILVVILLVQFQDIANYTRILPSERELVFKKFVERVNTTPKVHMHSHRKYIRSLRVIM